MLTITSDPRNVSKVESFVENLVSKYKISPDQHGNILISLTEAVTNAIRHGNLNDNQKKVKVSLKKQGNGLAVKVSDEGEGFDVQNLPDPTAPENRCKCGGRGVFLMRQLSDEVNFLNNGSTVEMHFSLRH